MDLLQQLRQLQLIRPLETQFADFIEAQEQQQLQPEMQQELRLLAALVSLQLAKGEVCLPLSQWQGLTRDWPHELQQQINGLLQNISAADLQQCSVISDGSYEAPLVLQNDRLYLYRYWRYETGVADWLVGMAEPIAQSPEKVKLGLQQLFPATGQGLVDWQQVAVAVAISRRFSVISGGPGTGKTTTVTRLLALYASLFSQQHNQTPIIRLAAPTGKAAARLSESLGQARDKLDIPADLKGMIPDQASTLHRLLGPRPESKNFRHNSENPLHLDLLVVDEASMIDLPMIWRLLDALPPQAQLILIGDKDQLASVEAGSVLGDICAWPQFDSLGDLRYSQQQNSYLNDVCGLEFDDAGDYAIADALALLRRSYRFDADSGIGQLAKAVNRGDSTAALQLFNQQYQDINHLPLSEQGYEQLLAEVVKGYREYLQQIKSGAEPKQVLNAFNQIQLLAVIREGVYGVNGLNEAIEQRLHRAGLICRSGLWYSGRPVMITRNDYQLGLFNGDIGIAMDDAEGRLRVWFELPDGELKGVLPGRLPSHETVYAMTVHKSQGSEFKRVLMLLPPDDLPLLTRELIYTGITRAKSSFMLLATNRIFSEGCQRRTERASGLGWRLWQR